MSADLAASLADGHRARLDKIWATLTARQRRLVAKTLDQIETDLNETRRGSWSAASSSSTLVQLAQSVRGLSTKQLASLRRALPGVAAQAQADTATWVRALDESFLGSTTPLAWDSLEWLGQTRDPLMRSRLRIYRKSFQRYGAEAVSAIEDAVAQRVLVGTPWTEAREEVMDIVREQVGGKQWMVDRIVRTESSTVANAVTMSALRAEDDDPDDPMLKKLVATFDASTGQDSRLLHGQTRPIGQPFLDVRSGREYMAPPNRPNDREIVVGWRRSWGDDREFDQETREAEPVDGETMTQAEIDAMVSEAVEEAAPAEAPVDPVKLAREYTGEDAYPDEYARAYKIKPLQLDPNKKRGLRRGAASRFKKRATFSITRDRKKPDQAWVDLKKRDPDAFAASYGTLDRLHHGLKHATTEDFTLDSAEHLGRERTPDAWCGMWHNIGINFEKDRDFMMGFRSDLDEVLGGRTPWSSGGHFVEYEYGRRTLYSNTMAHEFGHSVEIALKLRSYDNHPESVRLLAMIDDAVEQVNIATWGADYKTNPVLSDDKNNTWLTVSRYAMSDPRTEGLAESFALAVGGKWEKIPAQLHAPLRLMLEPKP